MDGDEGVIDMNFNVGRLPVEETRSVICNGEIFFLLEQLGSDALTRTAGTCMCTITEVSVCVQMNFGVIIASAEKSEYT